MYRSSKLRVNKPGVEHVPKQCPYAFAWSQAATTAYGFLAFGAQEHVHARWQDTFTMMSTIKRPCLPVHIRVLRMYVV